MKKRIILLLDGTWNDADNGPADTNIVRLRELIASYLTSPQRISPQEVTTPTNVANRASLTSGSYGHYDYLVYYERGVGTGGFFDFFFGGAFGAGLGQNVRHAYRFLSNNYTIGDEVFVFGFSRGSFTARSLVGYIQAAGLLQPEFCTRENESLAWAYYRSAAADRNYAVGQQLSAWSFAKFRFKSLAVFDTVGAMGVPLQAFWRENRDLFGFHNTSLSEAAEFNFHALASDEHRTSFEPTLWRQPKFRSSTGSVEQVWFPGAHSDVGGGYIDEERRAHDQIPALDDLTLDWLLTRIRAKIPDFPVEEWPKASSVSALATQHEARKGAWKLLPKALRSIANTRVPIRQFERNVARDRHAIPVGEGLHISVVERLGRLVRMDKRITCYAPANIVAALDKFDPSATEAALPIIGYTTDRLSDKDAINAIAEARFRLSENQFI